ncbi:MAG: ABC transporter permease [Desulfatitalea sp.]|nr:ABC transporter permease [Desulfatitalea sp.]
MPTKNATRWPALLPWILPGLLLLAWGGVSAARLVPTYLLPSPGDIVAAAHGYIFGAPGEAPYAGRFLTDLRASLLRVCLGFGLAVLLGLPLGILSGRLATFQKLVGNTIHAARAVPGIAWLPLALVWFGIGLPATTFLVGLAAFFPIYLNTAGGARQINPLLYQAGAMMGIGRVRGIFAILLPAAMPQIVSGLRLGLGIAWAYLVLGELTGVPDGLGAIIMDARMLGRIDMIMVGIIVIAVMGRLSDDLLQMLLKIAFKSARRLP